MAEEDKQQQGLEKTNAEYQKVIGLVIQLSTASLVLPPLFLRDFAGIQNNRPLINLFNWQAWLGWVFLLFAIISGLAFHYLSAKWIKRMYNAPVYWTAKTHEKLLDASFWVACGGFILGIGFFIWFSISII